MTNDVMGNASAWWFSYICDHDVSTFSDVVASLLSDLRGREESVDDSWQDYTYLHRYESLFKDPAIRIYVEMLLKEKREIRR